MLACLPVCLSVCLPVTSFSRCFHQALPSDEDTQLLSWKHTDVVEIHKRRYMLKDNALEIFLINGVTTLLSFEASHVCHPLPALDVVHVPSPTA